MRIPRLRELRELQGWTQKDLARLSGVSARSIAGYEAGAGARPNTARKLAEALDVSVVELAEPAGPSAPELEGRIARYLTPWRDHLDAVSERWERWLERNEAPAESAAELHARVTAAAEFVWLADELQARVLTVLEPLSAGERMGSVWEALELERTRRAAERLTHVRGDVVSKVYRDVEDRPAHEVAEAMDRLPEHFAQQFLEASRPEA